MECDVPDVYFAAGHATVMLCELCTNQPLLAEAAKHC